MMNDAQKSMQEWLTRNNLVVRICDGAITFCATAVLNVASRLHIKIKTTAPTVRCKDGW